MYPLLKRGLRVAVLLLMVAPAWADKALVVGVNTYPDLPARAQLKGCVNDAQDMAAALRRYHFDVRLLCDADATQAGIFAALADLGGRVTPAERFVLYFAGHGCNQTNRSAAILPSDARANSESNDIKADELHRRVMMLKARSYTVVLDSCFSGGMSRDLGVGGPAALRCYTRGKTLYEASNSDETAPGAGTGGTVCYFTAARVKEPAGEDEFDGQRRGIFTYYLTPQLKGGNDLWGDLQGAVAAVVSERTQDSQHPTLTPSFAKTVVFENVPVIPPAPQPVKPQPVKPQPVTPQPVTPQPVTPQPVTPQPVTPAPPKPHSLWEDYNTDRPDPTKVHLVMAPARGPYIKDRTLLKFGTKVGDQGWLVILERDQKDQLYVRFPKSLGLTDAVVAPGQVVQIPLGRGFRADAVGDERLRAVLFTSPDDADKLLQVFRDKGASLPRRSFIEQAQARTLVEVGDFYTSDVQFPVVTQEVAQQDAP